MVLHRVANPASLQEPVCVRVAHLPPFFAGLAQLVEQLICNQWVAGSSPATGTSHGSVAEWLLHLS